MLRLTTWFVFVRRVDRRVFVRYIVDSSSYGGSVPNRGYGDSFERA
jgi:hypothetical protein